jgi:hypothetical protein
MIRSLSAWIFLSLTTLALLGCGADNRVASELENEPCKGADAVSPACVPPPTHCELLPTPEDCLPDLLSITSPDRNSLWSTPTMRLAVSFLEDSVPPDLQLKLNGHDVLPRARISTSGAIIEGEDIESMLVDGDNTFQASSGSEIEQLVFIYDRDAPRIIVTSASNSASGTVSVSGVVRDAAPVSSLTINGIGAAIRNGHDFTAEIPSADIYRLVASDASGQTGTINFAAPQHLFDPAVALQVNNSIFNLIKPLINEALGNLDSSSLINAGRRVPLGTAEIAMSRLDINKGGEPAIDLHFVPVALTSPTRPMIVEVGVTLPVVGMGLQVYKKNGIYPQLDLDLDLSDVDVTLQLTLSVDDANRLKLGLTSAAPFHLAFSDITVNRFDVSCLRSGCISFADVANLLFDNASVRTALQTFLNNGLASSLDNALARLSLPNVPTNFPLDIDGDGANDTQISMNMAPSLLTTDAWGDSRMEFAGNIYVPGELIAPGYRGALGSVYVDTGAAPAFDRVASNGSEYDLGIALPSNIMNQALLSLDQSGVLGNIAMTMKPDDLGSMGALLAGLGVDSSADLRMRLIPGAVPYITLDHAPQSAGKTAGIKFHLHNAVIYMDVKKAGEAHFSVMLAMVADITANLELGMDSNNFIDLDTNDLIGMDVVAVLPEGLAAPGSALAARLTPALIESRIRDAVATLLKAEALSDALQRTLEISVTMAQDSDFLLHLPYQLGAIAREIRVDGSDTYLMLQLDLLNDAETQNSVEPLTARINIDQR